jgi:hypothetical protein
MQALAESARTVLERTAIALPDSFPERVVTKIAGGIRRQAGSFL